ncbi:MAG: YfcC family protein [Ruminococcaceae bacterium]|nr:YfcC family protein [Oscillospiraceae bacterium]
MDKKSSLKISKKSFISSVLILLLLMICAGVLTILIPSGEFQRTEVDGREAIIPNTFTFKEGDPYPVWRWFTAPFETLVGDDAVTVISIILFICVVGGTFTVLDKSGMLRFIMTELVKRFERSKYTLMAVLILFFMLFGSVFGIFEELVALVPIVILLSYALGWDSLTGLGMSALAAGFGFSAATLNPFTLGVAQELAGIPPFSGIAFRAAVFCVCYVILYLFVRFHAKRVEKDPSRSPVYIEDKAQREQYADTYAAEKLHNSEHLKKTVIIFGASLAAIILYIIAGFFFPVLSSVSLPVMGIFFLVGGLTAAAVSHYGGSIAKDFLSGVGAIAPSGLLIMMAMSVKLIITEGGIIDTILFYLSEKVSGMGRYGAAVMIFLLVLLLNFFVSSGSAKAFLLMPIIAPLSELVGLSGQVAVLAFCFGDGFTNMLYPTNALLIITLGLTVVSYPKWFRWTIPLQLLMLAVNILLLLIAIFIGF